MKSECSAHEEGLRSALRGKQQGVRPFVSVHILTYPDNKSGSPTPSREPPVTPRLRVNPQPGRERAEFFTRPRLGMRDRAHGVADHRMDAGLLRRHAPGALERAEGAAGVAVIQPGPRDLDVVVAGPHRRQIAKAAGPLHLPGPG